LTVTIQVDSINNPPNQPDQPYGPTTGEVGINYEYTFTATDPENDNISYYVDWDDGSFSGWTEQHPSGDSITLSHKWSDEKSYDIRVKVKDEQDLEGFWSEILTVAITESEETEPELEVSIDTGFGLLVEKVSAQVLNIGEAAASNVNFTLSVEYGILNNEKENSTDISILEPDNAVTVEVDELYGFGPITVTAVAYADNVETVTDEVSGFIIGRFIFLVFQV
jgi:hypothetical protein